MNDIPNDAEIGSKEQPDRPVFAGGTVSIVDELKSSYLDYAMSVIVSRALPDLRDGLKPVHRRILYSMLESGNTHDKSYRKSARPVGEVMGKYHPHGDGAIYDALVRMAQDFSMSLPLLDGQGNFGSMDGDNPAAMRYTEVRMAKPAQMLLADIDRNTVDFFDNYDGKDREPSVLPARFPNILVNGASGIAVGMATNIPPHNLGEVIDATLAMIEDSDISIERLMEFLPAPDFPTGGVIQGVTGARKAYLTGRGTVFVRAKTRIEEVRRDRFAIIVEEIPYQVNKSTLVEKIATVAQEKKVEGIAHVQDESDRFGVRIVIEIKRAATPEIVLNQLWRHTQLETSFSCNMLALNGGRPEQMKLSRFLRSFLEFREEVVARRTVDLLRRARARSHILCGLAVAVSNVDEVVAIIRASSQPVDARQRLMEREWPASEIEEYIRLIDDPDQLVSEAGTYKLTEIQARAILDLRLQRLTAMGVRENTDELQSLATDIREYLSILGSGERIRAIIADELRCIRDEFAIPRRTMIDKDADILEDEDFIESEDMVVTITKQGYIKRTPLADFRLQRRGGKGSSGMTTKDADVVTSLYVVNSRDSLLFFTTDGKAYRLKTWKLPKGGRATKGKAIVNLLDVPLGVSVDVILPVRIPEEDWSNHQIVFATSHGNVRRSSLEDFTRINRSGKIAMKVPEGERLIGARICMEGDNVMLGAASGQVIRFPATEQALRIFKSRDSTGVRGIRLKEGDHLVSIAVVKHFEATPLECSEYLKFRQVEEDSSEPDEYSENDEPSDRQISEERLEQMREAEELLLTISESGAGKISSGHNYRLQARGGKGVSGLKGGNMIAFLKVEASNQIMLTTNTGKSLRCDVSDISFRRRTAGGVKVLNIAPDERVVSVARIERIVEEGEEDSENGEQDESSSSIDSQSFINS